MTHAHDAELVDLLRMISEKLNQFTNEIGDKQTCNIEMRHLYMRIYFNPGLGLPVTLLERFQSVPPCKPEKVEQKFLISHSSWDRLDEETAKKNEDGEGEGDSKEKPILLVRTSI